MSDATPTELNELIARCDRFQAAWKAGAGPVELARAARLNWANLDAESGAGARARGE